MTLPREGDDIPIIILDEEEPPGAEAAPGPAPEAPPTRPPPRRSIGARADVLLGLLVALALLAIVLAGRTYYATPLAQRPFHAYHPVLRPSGHLGLILGVAGTFLMLLNLGYLVRKLLLRVRWLGSLRGWMSLHVLTGLLGPALILLHSAFAPCSALGTLALGAMLVAVGAGLVGRYLYAHTPRSLEGHELELEEVRKRLAGYRSEMEALGIDPGSVLAGRPAAVEDASRPGGVPGAVLRIVRGDLERRRRYRILREGLRASPELAARAPDILSLFRALLRETEWSVRYRELRGLMASWRFLHRWLAIAMLLVAAFHIAIALGFGDFWILRGLLP